MFLSTSTWIMNKVLAERTKNCYTPSMEETLTRLKAAGYDYADMNFWGESAPGRPLSADNWEDWVHSVRQCADKLGIRFNQTHCSTKRTLEWDDPNFDNVHMNEMIRRSIVGSAILGAKWTVMHPLSLPRQGVYNSSACKDAAMRFLTPHIDYAVQNNVGVALETMIDFRRGMRRYCSGDIFELTDLVDTFNDRMVGICLDTGHANLSGLDIPQTIRIIGDRLKCTHINDNHGGTVDEHLLPYFGMLDWNSIVKALKETGYENDFAFEVHSALIPNSVTDVWLTYTNQIGRQLISIV